MAVPMAIPMAAKASRAGRAAKHATPWYTRVEDFPIGRLINSEVSICFPAQQRLLQRGGSSRGSCPEGSLVASLGKAGCAHVSHAGIADLVDAHEMVGCMGWRRGGVPAWVGRDATVNSVHHRILPRPTGRDRAAACFCSACPVSAACLVSVGLRVPRCDGMDEVAAIYEDLPTWHLAGGR